MKISLLFVIPYYYKWFFGNVTENVSENKNVTENVTDK